MDLESGLGGTTRRMWRGRATVVERIFLSLITGLILAAAAVAAAWAIGTQSGSGRVRDEHIGITLACGAVAWCVALGCIWVGFSAGRHGARAVVGTILVGVATIAAGAAITVFAPREAEFLIVSACLCSGAVMLLIWLPVVQRRFRGRPLIDASGQVDVRCPVCGYCLIGLRELRCPECGTTFTIDELIRAQNYGALKQSGWTGAVRRAALSEVLPAGRKDARPDTPAAQAVEVDAAALTGDLSVSRSCS